MSRIRSIQIPYEAAAMTAPARRRVTLTDIAKACELSRATVSLVLRGSPLVHADTRARVEAELKRQGYVYHRGADQRRSEEHTSELQSLMRISYAVFCLKKKNKE